MPEHVLMSEIEIITDGDRRHHWSASAQPRVARAAFESPFRYSTAELDKI
jgi:transposase